MGGLSVSEKGINLLISRYKKLKKTHPLLLFCDAKKTPPRSSNAHSFNRNHISAFTKRDHPSLQHHWHTPTGCRKSPSNMLRVSRASPSRCNAETCAPRGCCNGAGAQQGAPTETSTDPPASPPVWERAYESGEEEEEGGRRREEEEEKGGLPQTQRKRWKREGMESGCADAALWRKTLA